MDQPLVFVTGSSAKAREAEEILGRAVERVDLDLPEIQAPSIEEIAREKSREAFRRLGRACVVEDSALSFTAWGGMPGPFIKWFQNAAGLEGLCRSLDGFSDRSAAAICVLAFRSETDPLLAVGRVEGTIALHPRGDGGFGWDPIFIPRGSDRTFAEMTAVGKNAISHRRRAWEDLTGKLDFYFSARDR